MGHDPVALAKRAKYKPPAMRVHGVCYTKNHLSAIMRLFKPIYSERKGDLMANKANSLAHTKWMCKYHIVFTPKYRRKVIYNQYKESIRDILKQLCVQKGRDTGRASDAGSRPYAGKHTTPNKCITIYGISEW